MNKLINKDMIILELDGKDKNYVIEKLAKKIEENGKLNNFEGYIEQVHKREATFPTSVGFSVAIPHGKCDSVKTSGVAFARLTNEVKWSEEENVKYVFLIAVPESEAGDTHLKILAQLSRKIMREQFRNDLENASDVEEVLSLLDI